jgi:hypothetical protein
VLLAGNVNYDGSVTISDFIDLASNFNQSISGETSPISASDAAMLTDSAAASGASAVPEPTCLLIIPGRRIPDFSPHTEIAACQVGVLWCTLNQPQRPLVGSTECACGSAGARLVQPGIYRIAAA